MQMSARKQIIIQYLEIFCAPVYLVDSTVEKGSREVEGLLGANWPVTAQIQPIDKHNTFLPALWTQR